MSRTFVVSVSLAVSLMLSSLQCSAAYDVYGRVNEPLHIDDSQVSAILVYSPK